MELPPLRVLIADDVPQNLELLALTLEGNNHQVTMAHDGEEAFQLFCSGNFDVVLMDMHMPGTDGLQATRMIRTYERNQQLPPTPVIALTASVMEEDQRAATRAGMDGFAIKPLDMQQLFGEIARVLNLQISPVKQTASVNKASVQQLIDWDNGIARWGNRARLESAICQFLQNVDHKYPLKSEGEDEAYWQGLLFSLHGIRGAAGTLSMPSIAELAIRLEQLIHQNQRTEARLQLPDLQQQICLAQQEISTVQNTAPSKRVAPPFRCDEVLSEQIRQLMNFLAHNELHDELLEQVCCQLEQKQQRKQANALRTAIDSFEFAQAHTLLESLLTSEALNPTHE